MSNIPEEKSIIEHIMRNSTVLSLVAVATVAILVAVAATTVNGANMAYANKGGDKIKQQKL
jgi:hypothetical protein